MRSTKTWNISLCVRRECYRSEGNGRLAFSPIRQSASSELLEFIPVFAGTNRYARHHERTRTMLTLTATMIVRDEEDMLEGCLQSLSGVVDEIVIADTGSKDRSREIANDYGARVHDFVWANDFSVARNRAFELSRGDWNLYIDADERVRRIDRDHLNAVLSDNRNIAATVRFHPRVGYTAYREYRLYRNDPRIRFESAIHETPLRNLFRIVSEEDRMIAETDVTIDHLGYESDQHQKHLRNLPLLERAVAADTDRVYLWWHLGFVRAALEDHSGAEAAWLQGIEAVRAHGNSEPAGVLPYVELIWSRFVRGMCDMPLLTEALSRFPNDHQLQWLRGRILIGCGCFDEAIPIFKELTEVNPDTLVAAGSYDRKIFGLLSYDSLAYCHFKTGRFLESAHYYALAEKAAPEGSEYRIKGLLAAVRASAGSSRHGKT
jgi:glycosyltransferase involved in cell wall biosynthesis